MIWLCAIDVDQSITQFRQVQFEFPCCVRELLMRMMSVFNLDGQCTQSVLWDSGTKMNIPFDLMITMQPLERPLLKLTQTQQEVSIDCPVLLYSQTRSFTMIPSVDEFFQAALKLVPTQPVVSNPLSLNIKPSFFDNTPDDMHTQTFTKPLTATIQPPPVITIDNTREVLCTQEVLFTQHTPQHAPVLEPVASKPDFSKPEFRFF